MSFLVLLLRSPLTYASSEALSTTWSSAFLLVVKSGTSFSSTGSPNFSNFQSLGAESQGLFKLGFSLCFLACLVCVMEAKAPQVFH